MMDNQKVQKPYLPIVESPGILYLLDDDKQFKTARHAIINAVGSALPVLGIILFGAWMSGIIIWALVSHFYSRQYRYNIILLAMLLHFLL